jgi:GAF domain-containing protein
VDHGTQSACGLALSSGRPIAIENVTRHELFAEQPACEILMREGVWAVQSTPLLSSEGKVLGMLSTHFLRPTRLTKQQLQLARSFATLAGSYLQSRPEPRPIS